ncbi:recombinase family protein [Dankookia rubra]|uniref:Recombinase family protein n=1 Tax=Dankookia rubra TaxID=1442381 RepID=A0A4R5Q998_9PROT|nr:recombinase family protein [Dankookia rubra]TDH58727.1 recombinase family protein [Dankookia rubra]
MPVYGYCRVSTAAQAAEGESLEVQRRHLEGWALMQGQPLDAVFVERGVSGSVPLQDRPEGGRLWARLGRGDTLVASKLDRLFRSALDALQAVEDLKGRGVSLVLLDLGGDISTNGLSKLFLTIAAAFAEAERDRIRERVTQTKRDQRLRGRYLGGKLPYGFRVGRDGALEPILDQQVVIRRAVEMRAGGAPLRTVQAALEAEHGARLSLDVIQRVAREAAQPAEAAA